MSKPGLRAITTAAFAALALAAGDAFAATGTETFQEQLDKGWIWVHLAAFGFGFLTSLTPCVYPMIPIVVGVFGARDETATRRRAFALATAYVLGMGLMFSALGVVFAAVGKQANQLLANPWIVIPMVAVYVALAASMFGAFELNLPMSWQNRLNRVGGKGYGGAAGMGVVGGLTAAPCTGPFLVGLIGVVAATGNLVAGFTVMFAYAMGIGVLFWVIAVFAVSLPKSGRWMESVKSVGGIALLAVGVYFLRPVFPVLGKLTDPSVLFLVAAVAVTFAGIGLGAVHLSFHGSWATKLRKGSGVALAVVGLTGAVNWAVTPDRELPWHHDENAAFAAAEDQGKGVMVDFAAEWCAPCKKLETIFAEPGVYDMIVDDYVLLKFDVTEQSEADYALQDRYDVEGLPSVIFFDADGNELGRVTDKKPSKEAVLDTLRALPAPDEAGGQRAAR